MYKKMSTGYYQNNKERLQKKARERYQNLKKTKSKNIVVNDIKIFLKNKETKSVSMLKNIIETFQKMKNKG